MSQTSCCKRLRTLGKFLVAGDQKFFVKGTTYGAFPPNSQGFQFPNRDEINLDLRLMRACGINSILTYTVPPVSLLDQAQEHGIRVIATIPWMEYVCFLEEANTRREVRRQVKEAVASCRRHPAVLMYCIGKEIPPAIVRWHGPKKVEDFLRELCATAKDEDPESLVTYTNFPTTEYLKLDFVDVFTFNVYLHHRAQMCAYLSRLQHLAGELPFVLTEFGMCSFRHGREGQAEFLDWQIEEAFDHGLAGAVVFGWTDPFFQDNLLVTEWGFGLVDAERRPKPSYWAVKRRFETAIPFPPERRYPRVSVVVAAHNAGRTLGSCLESLTKLDYPDYEVVAVNDGSTDDTEEIIRRYPQFSAISTPHQGVSAARNVGLRAATGEIVAYIDADADADPDWLLYLVATYADLGVAGVGGPNLVPPTDNWVAQCVYRSPGGPAQVMLDDQAAEHIPGCNMSFRKDALEDVGGFDPIFRAAGDDVDICWRLLEKGYGIGFNPSAVVWHHRRPSVKAYWRQQVGYGVSESLLERKFPNKFNRWGHTFWGGRIYAPYPFFRLFGKPVIYHGLWGSAGFQPMYGHGEGGVLSFLPRAMEYHLGLGALLLLGLVFPWALVTFTLGLAYIFGYCAHCAAKAKVDVLEATDAPASFWQRFRWRAMIGFLHFLEPLARDWGRLKGGLTPWRSVSPGAPAEHQSSSWWQRIQPFRRVVRWAIPGTMALEKHTFLDRLLDKLTRRGCAVGWNPITCDWDLKVRRGALGVALLRMVVEHHGGPNRLARLSAVIRPPGPLYCVCGVTAALALAMDLLGHIAPAAALGIGFAVLWIVATTEANRLEAVALSTAAEVAEELELERASICRASAAGPYPA